MEVERFRQPLDRAVGRAVVDDEDVVFAVLERQERAYRLDAGGLLVVRGCDERNGRGPTGGDEVAQIEGLETNRVPPERPEREEARRQVDGVEQGEIEEDDIVEELQHRPEGLAHDASSSNNT